MLGVLRARFAIFVICFGMPAYGAACPDVSDLDQGIRLQRDQDNFNTVFQQNDGMLSEARSAQGRVIHARYGHPLMVSERWSDAGNDHMSLQYDASAAELDALVPGRRIERNVTLTMSDGVEVNGRVTWVVERFDHVTIGRCRYPVRQFHERMELEGYGTIRMVKFYAPDVGLILRSITVDEGWKPLRDVQFDQILRIGG
ncbi:hypothetical protein [Halocynthiibacter namhaensis]|uniref:hypothetical protein n=1 Tax=Halocynthiibacter namhaensis TaxID=1290553 RepID=UPI0005796BE1|nr:hypothetical protein [Halocynthiibacter namhaensis]